MKRDFNRVRGMVFGLALCSLLLVLSAEAAPIWRGKKGKRIPEPQQSHPALFVGEWDMVWGKLTYRTTLSAEGKYRAQAESQAPWVGKWWVDSSNRLWVEETRDTVRLRWGILLNTTLDGEIDRGSYLGTQVFFNRSKPDA